MLKDNFTLECSFDVLLNFANSTTEKNRALLFNKNIKANFYPLTKSYLVSHYFNTNYSNLKKTFKNISCAADVYSYYLMSYGYLPGTGNDRAGAQGANSSGLNPFSPFKVDLGFNLGSVSWLFWLAILAGAVYITKK